MTTVTSVPICNLAKSWYRHSSFRPWHSKDTDNTRKLPQKLSRESRNMHMPTPPQSLYSFVLALVLEYKKTCIKVMSVVGCLNSLSRRVCPRLSCLWFMPQVTPDPQSLFKVWNHISIILRDGVEVFMIVASFRCWRAKDMHLESTDELGMQCVSVACARVLSVALTIH